MCQTVRMITQDRLKELLIYDPETGVFRWRVKRNGIKPIEAGHRTGKGYWRITVEHRRYLRGPLAWFYMTGEWPNPEVDHRDRNRSNDRWSNLRLGTRAQQMMNGSYRSKSGFRGVNRNYNRWQARIRTDGIARYLGSFATPEEAHAAYVKAAAESHGDFAYHSDSPSIAG